VSTASVAPVLDRIDGILRRLAKMVRRLGGHVLHLVEERGRGILA
jgi:hypothetical protein